VLLRRAEKTGRRGAPYPAVLDGFSILPIWFIRNIFTEDRLINERLTLICHRATGHIGNADVSHSDRRLRIAHSNDFAYRSWEERLVR
jgi:hypothetical protein